MRSTPHIAVGVLIDAKGGGGDTLGRCSEREIGATAANPHRLGKDSLWASSPNYRQAAEFIAWQKGASRVRLPLKQMKRAQSTIVGFAPATKLDPGDNTSVVERDGELPGAGGFDPITVALHLHAAFPTAANDVVDYTSAHGPLQPGVRGSSVAERS